MPQEEELFCPSCRYEVTGLDDPVLCPECGREWTRKELLAFRSGWRRTAARAAEWLRRAPSLTPIACVVASVCWLFLSRGPFDALTSAAMGIAIPGALGFFLVVFPYMVVRSAGWFVSWIPAWHRGERPTAWAVVRWATGPVCVGLTVVLILHRVPTHVGLALSTGTYDRYQSQYSNEIGLAPIRVPSVFYEIDWMTLRPGVGGFAYEMKYASDTYHTVYVRSDDAPVRPEDKAPLQQSGITILSQESIGRGWWEVSIRKPYTPPY